MYIQDYDEVLPPLYITTPGLSGGYYHTPEVLNPYVKNVQLWLCPSDTQSYQAFEDPAGLRINYGYNQSRFVGRANFDGFLSQARIETPSETIVLIDDSNLYAGPYSPAVPTTYNPGENLLNDPANTAGTRAVNRHNETYNMSFADGHVKAMKDTQYRHWSYWAD